MIESLLAPVTTFVTHTIQTWGYAGVGVLMAIESMNIPLPSEVILPFAGWMVSQDFLNIHLTALAGAFGCVAGSVLSYLLGFYGGRPFLLKYGKWLLISQKDFHHADVWVKKYGMATFFIGRILPVVRTFISLPGGILKVPLGQFLATTFVGSWIWSYALIYVGIRLGNEWERLKPLWHKFDIAIVAIGAVGFGYFIWRHIKQIRSEQQSILPTPPSSVQGPVAKK